MLLPLKERAERILKDLEERRATGLEAMDRLAAIAREKEAALAAANNSGLSPRAFGVYWALKDDKGLRMAEVGAEDLGKQVDSLLGRFPNAAVNGDEQRRLRAALYQPLLGLDKDKRSRVVEDILAILLGASADADI